MPSNGSTNYTANGVWGGMMAGAHHGHGPMNGGMPPPSFLQQPQSHSKTGSY